MAQSAVRDLGGKSSIPLRSTQDDTDGFGVPSNRHMNPSDQSSKLGFFVATRAFFFSRFQPFNCFSRVIAEYTSLVVSKYNNFFQITLFNAKFLRFCQFLKNCNKLPKLELGIDTFMRSF